MTMEYEDYELDRTCSADDDTSDCEWMGTKWVRPKRFRNEHMVDVYAGMNVMTRSNAGNDDPYSYTAYTRPMLLWPINEHTDSVIGTDDDDIYPYFNNAITWGAAETPCDRFPNKYDITEHAFARDCDITTFDFHEGTWDWAGAGF